MAWRPKDWKNPYRMDLAEEPMHIAYEEGANAMLNALKPEILQMKKEYREELAKLINKEDVANGNELS